MSKCFHSFGLFAIIACLLACFTYTTRYHIKSARQAERAHLDQVMMKWKTIKNKKIYTQNEIFCYATGISFRFHNIERGNGGAVGQVVRAIAIDSF